MQTPEYVISPTKMKMLGYYFLPGFLYVTIGTILSYAIHWIVPLFSPLIAGVVLGAIVSNAGLLKSSALPGLTLATKKLLRLGVILLGLQLSIFDVFGLGAHLLLIVFSVILFGFFFTYFIGRKLGLSDNLSILTATGFSICGASAIAAMQGARDANEDEVAIAIALVTIYGTLAMFVWPFLQTFLFHHSESYGAWSGASVHEVAQVVAAAAAGGSDSLSTAIVVKLARVIMLAPMVALAAFSMRSKSVLSQSRDTRPPLIPLFVLGFLVMILIRTSGFLPTNVLNGAKILTTIFLTAALFGLGIGVKARLLIVTGPRALLLGALSTITIATVSYIGIFISIGI